MAYIVVMTSRYIFIPKLTKLYTLNMFSFLHVRHNSKNRFKKKKEGDLV